MLFDAVQRGTPVFKLGLDVDADTLIGAPDDFGRVNLGRWRRRGRRRIRLRGRRRLGSSGKVQLSLPYGWEIRAG